MALGKVKDFFEILSLIFCHRSCSIFLFFVGVLLTSRLVPAVSENTTDNETGVDGASAASDMDYETTDSELVEVDGLMINKSEIKTMNFGDFFQNLTTQQEENPGTDTSTEDETSPEAAREKLMKVNPNLVNFIEKVMKVRDHHSGHIREFFPHTWKYYEDRESADDLSDICLFSPTGACHVFVTNKCKVITYESLFIPKGFQNDSCRLHEKYIYHDFKPDLKLVTDLKKYPSFNNLNHSSLRVRYKCEMNTNLFPANQSGIVKYLSPAQFMKVVNGSRSCILAMFFSPYCVFSVKFAPHVNALARNFPAIHVVAVNALLNKQ